MALRRRIVEGLRVTTTGPLSLGSLAPKSSEQWYREVRYNALHTPLERDGIYASLSRVRSQDDFRCGGSTGSPLSRR